MSTFSHHDVGRTDATWLASELVRTPTIEAPNARDHLLVIAAHPDDETLGAGGLMALAGASGALVSVVVATDGEASHPTSPSHSPTDLARLRRAEVRNAVRTVAPAASVDFLGLPDGRLSEHYDGLLSALASVAPTATVVASTWTADEHPDHEACGRAAAAVAERLQTPLWQFPIWAWHWGDPDTNPLPWQQIRRLELPDDARRAKADAVACHVSQHAALSAEPGDEPILHADMLTHFERLFETFVVTAPPDASTAAYFDTLYAEADDPWRLADRFYERRKRNALLAALPRPRFGRAFEPGCATGLLTEQLAVVCDEVIAWDTAQAAVRQAAARMRPATGVRVEHGSIPDDWPVGRFDLLVLCEVGYYCPSLPALAARIAQSLGPDGCLVACHWRRDAPAHPHNGDEVHSALAAIAGLHRVVSHAEDDFLLDVWTRSGRSVAQDEGLVR